MEEAISCYDDDSGVWVPTPQRARRGLSKVVGALIATLVVVGLLLVQVWSRYRILTLGYELSELTTEREQLLEANRRLRIELRVLTRTDRLDPMARRQLGLIPPRPDQILFVRASELPLPSFPALEAPAETVTLADPTAVGSDAALFDTALALNEAGRLAEAEAEAPSRDAKVEKKAKNQADRKSDKRAKKRRKGKSTKKTPKTDKADER